MSDWNWIRTDRMLPSDGQIVDWIAPSGDQVDGGKYYSRMWFLPKDHSMYCYYRPTFWRPAQ